MEDMISHLIGFWSHQFNTWSWQTRVNWTPHEHWEIKRSIDHFKLKKICFDGVVLLQQGRSRAEPSNNAVSQKRLRTKIESRFISWHVPNPIFAVILDNNKIQSLLNICYSFSRTGLLIYKLNIFVVRRRRNPIDTEVLGPLIHRVTGNADIEKVTFWIFESNN